MGMPDTFHIYQFQYEFVFLYSTSEHKLALVCPSQAYLNLNC